MAVGACGHLAQDLTGITVERRRGGGRFIHVRVTNESWE
jgi:hypothetical protein